MEKIRNELLHILYDTNGYNNKNESQNRMLKLFNNLQQINSNNKNFKEKIENLRSTINQLPQNEIDFFEEILKKYEGEKK